MRAVVRHQVRAEYENEDVRAQDRSTDTEQDPNAVRSWHMAREGENVAMCGRALRPGGAARPEEAWGSTDEPFCHTCGALYLREVP